MNKNHELKAAKVSEIVEMLKAAKSVAVVKYDGLTVAQVTDLRKQCREANVQYAVLKNKLVARAFNEMGYEFDSKLLEGPNAFVFSMGDEVSGPKTVSSFITKNKLESLKVMGGVVEGKVVDAAAVNELASMPSREELLATLVGCLVSPVSSLVAVLDEIADTKAA